MEADEYERKYMNLDGPVRFRDRQRSKRPVAEVGGVALLIASVFAFGLDWPFVAFIALIAALALALGTTMSSCRVVLTDRSLHLQYGLRTHRIPLTAVEDVSVTPAAAGVVPAHGSHAPSLFASVLRRYRAEGLRETVQVRWRQAGRTKITLIGTDRATELEGRLTETRDSLPPPARGPLGASDARWRRGRRAEPNAPPIVLRAAKIHPRR